MADTPPMNFEKASRYLTDLPSPTFEDGRPNPEHYRRRMLRVNLAAEERVMSGQSLPNTKAALDGIREEAKLAGLDPERLMGTKSDAEMVVDAVQMLLERGGESLFEQTDEQLDAIERGFEIADGHCQDIIDGHHADAIDKNIDPVVIDKVRKQRTLGKVWTAAIRRLRTLRMRARLPIPPMTEPGYEHGVEAAHLVRFGVYVDRSNMETSQDAGADVIQVHEAMCRFAVAVWEAEEKVWFHAGGVQKDGYDYRGFIGIMPPGHGKSTLGQWWLARRIKRNPYTQAIVLHASGDMAVEINKYVRELINPDSPAGRRAAALYGSIPIDQDSAKITRLEIDRSIKSPTIRAAGVLDRRSGANADTLYVDDPNDQEVRTDEPRRKKTYDRLTGTWLRRLRGPNTFMFTVSTIWHKADSTQRQIDGARKGLLPYKVINLKCGGPDDTPPFYPVWPGVYGADFLRQVYYGQVTPSEYAAYYQGNPTDASDKAVRAISFYDPEAMEHQRFLQSCHKALSIDPSGGNKSKSDVAGFLCAGMGVLTETLENGVRSHRTVLRVLDAKELRANQTEMVEYGGNYALANDINEIHVETKSGYVATAEMFENKYGISPIRHDPMKGKLTRLEQCAAAIEAHKGRQPPVQFPGRLNEDTGKVEADPKWEWLYEQVLDAGFTAQDGVLDTITQLVLHYAPSLNIGRAARKQQAVATQTPDRHSATEKLEKWYEDRLQQLRFGSQDKAPYSDEALVMREYGS